MVSCPEIEQNVHFFCGSKICAFLVHTSSFRWRCKTKYIFFLSAKEPFVKQKFVFNIKAYIRVVGKMPKQHFNAILFSNPGDKVLILVESRGQICPIVFTLLRILSPGLENYDTLKCWSCIFQLSWHNCLCCKIVRTIFKYMVVLQSRGQDFIFVQLLWSQDLRVKHKIFLCVYVCVKLLLVSLSTCAKVKNSTFAGKMKHLPGEHGTFVMV